MRHTIPALDAWMAGLDPDKSKVGRSHVEGYEVPITDAQSTKYFDFYENLGPSSQGSEEA